MTLLLSRRSFNAVAAAAAVCVAPQGFAQGAPFPDRAIHIVVAYPAGGGTDAAGRQMAQRIAERLSAQVIVENRPGAGGGLGTLMVARSQPDGYTLAVGGVGTQISARTLFPELKLDPMKELAPIALLTSAPHALVVSASSPISSVAQLVEAARTRKGGLVYASGGAGSTTHLAVEMFSAMAHLKLEHVPYKGSSPAHLDLVAGRVDFMMDILSSVTPLIKSGRLRLLAVSTATRLPQFANVPTIAETPGFAGFEALSWTGLFAPRRTAPQIIRKLSDALNDPRDDPAFKAQVEANGASYTPMDATQFDAFVKAEYARWSPIAEKTLR
jgi:tripartite-type tricarboxylate transporter receptor subunit TctC